MAVSFKAYARRLWHLRGLYRATLDVTQDLQSHSKERFILIRWPLKPVGLLFYKLTYFKKLS